jgi:Mg-chelatase subunit ChlD
MSRGWRSGFVAAATLAAALILASSLPHAAGRAQAPTDPELRIIDVDDSAFPTVRVVIEVARGGRPATELQVGDLVVRENGSTATVTSVRKAVDASVPLTLVVALDVSGSMAGTTLTNAQAAAILLIENLAPADSAALVSFAQSAQLNRPVGTDKAVIIQSVRELQAAGNTALYDAVILSAEVAGASSGFRRAVVLLSDGEDFGGLSSASREASLAQAAASGSVFYVIGVGQEVDSAYLEELALRTGGRYYLAPGASEIAGIYQSLSELLRSQFVVEVESGAEPGRGDREVSVSLVGDSVVTVTRGYQSRQPLPTPSPSPATPTPTAPPPSPTPTAATERSTVPGDESTGGTNWPAILALSVAALGSGAGVAAFVVRRRGRATTPPLQSTGSFSAPETPNEPQGLARATFVFEGSSFGLSEDAGPFVIGSSGECQVRLPEGPAVGGIHARLWWRDGKLMVHHLARGTETLVNGSPVEWVSLSDGDEITIGPHVLAYRSTGT